MTVGTDNSNKIAIAAKFSQALASNCLKIRNQGFKKVRTYLIKKSQEADGIDKDEMLHIWKGLFYCMWMSDKPDVQEQLASRMADVLLELKSDEGKQIYFEEFLTTMQREWTGIDRLRMDKYFLLFRFMIQRCFEYQKAAKWAEKQVSWFLTLLKEGPLHPTNINTRTCPLGIRYHITDIYLDELESCCDDGLSGGKLTQMFEPFFLMLQQSKIDVLCTRIVEKILQVIIDKSPPALKIIYENTNMKVEGMKFNFDYSGIADMLFEHAQYKGIQNRNRKLLYSLVKKFRELASGDVALDDFPDLTAFDGLAENEENEEKLVEALTKQYDDDHIESMQEKRQMKKFRKAAGKIVEPEPFSVDVMMSENDGDVPVATVPEDDDVTEEMDVVTTTTVVTTVTTTTEQVEVEEKKSNPNKKGQQEATAKVVDVVEPTPVDAPVVDAAVVDAAVVDAVVVDAAVADAAVVDAAVVDAAVVDAPVVDAPVFDAPVVDAPVVDAAVADEATPEVAEESSPAVDDVSDDDAADISTTESATASPATPSKKSHPTSSRGLTKSGKRRFRRRMSDLKKLKNASMSSGVELETSTTTEEPQKKVAKKQPKTEDSEPQKKVAKKQPKTEESVTKPVEESAPKLVSAKTAAMDAKKVEKKKKTKKRKSPTNELVEVDEPAVKIAAVVEPVVAVVEGKKKKTKKTPAAAAVDSDVTAAVEPKKKKKKAVAAVVESETPAVTEPKKKKKAAVVAVAAVVEAETPTPAVSEPKKKKKKVAVVAVAAVVESETPTPAVSEPKKKKKAAVVAVAAVVEAETPAVTEPKKKKKKVVAAVVEAETPTPAVSEPKKKKKKVVAAVVEAETPTPAVSEPKKKKNKVVAAVVKAETPTPAVSEPKKKKKKVVAAVVEAETPAVSEPKKKKKAAVAAVAAVVEAETPTPAVTELVTSSVDAKKKKKKRRSSMCPAEVTESLGQSVVTPQKVESLFQVPAWDDDDDIMEAKLPAFMQTSVIKLKAKKKKEKKNVLQTPPPRPAVDQSMLTKSGKKVVFAIAKNQVKLFQGNDRSAAVGQRGVTGVAFDPAATPTSSQLKKRNRPAGAGVKKVKKVKKPQQSLGVMKSNVTKRKSASDFF